MGFWVRLPINCGFMVGRERGLQQLLIVLEFLLRCCQGLYLDHRARETPLCFLLFTIPRFPWLSRLPPQGLPNFWLYPLSSLAHSYSWEYFLCLNSLGFYFYPHVPVLTLCWGAQRPGYYHRFLGAQSHDFFISKHIGYPLELYIKHFNALSHSSSFPTSKYHSYSYLKIYIKDFLGVTQQIFRGF